MSLIHEFNIRRSLVVYELRRFLLELSWGRFINASFDSENPSRMGGGCFRLGVFTSRDMDLAMATFTACSGPDEGRMAAAACGKREPFRRSLVRTLCETSAV